MAMFGNPVNCEQPMVNTNGVGLSDPIPQLGSLVHQGPSRPGVLKMPVRHLRDARDSTPNDDHGHSPANDGLIGRVASQGFENVDKVLVIDGDAISPIVASFLAGPLDCVMFASNNKHDSKRLMALLNACQAGVWHVPTHTQAADMALAYYIGKTVSCHPALRKARWLFVSSDKSFGILKPLLMDEGVPEQSILQVRVESIKQAGDRVITNTLQEDTASLTGERQPNAATQAKPAQKADGRSLSPLAKQVWKLANPSNLPRIARTRLVKFILSRYSNAKKLQYVDWEQSLRASITAHTGSKRITKQAVEQWVNHQPYSIKGQHIGIK